MPLTLKNKYEVTVAVDKIRVIDKTGAYNATTNAGGWGAPNPELDEVALWATVVRKALSGDEYFAPSTVNYVYDPVAANSKETTIEFKYSNDGVFNIYLGYLSISENGDTYLVGGGAIQDGDFFYWSSGGKFIWQRVGGVNQEATLAQLIASDDVSKVLCEDLVAARLSVEAQKKYKKYRIQRLKKVDDAEPLFDEINKLFTDIQGAYYTFYSNLKVEAQSQIESLLDAEQLLNV
jgi:hypothetical protein